MSNLEIVDQLKEAKMNRHGILQIIKDYGITSLQEKTKRFCERSLEKVNSLILHWIYCKMSARSVAEIRLLHQAEKQAYSVTIMRLERNCVVRTIKPSFV